MSLQGIKQRFGIIGVSNELDRSIEIASQVAPTDLSVLVTGESGAGKEVFPKIIHSLSARKHNKYIAVNCGAIPEGTIDSELFGHEKGAFTGAHESRKGYFEVADEGTIFLDEVAELPLTTQVRLLRVLETGEFIRVGSSKVIKTNVRVVAATNVNIPQAVKNNKFREDLYYRLNTVPIRIPALRERQQDVALLFRKFAHDFAEKYRMPAIRLDDEARQLLLNYRWPGNIRQLKNVAEQISVIETDRMISLDKLAEYIPIDNEGENVPSLGDTPGSDKFTEREILYKVLFEMKKELGDLKKLVLDLMHKKDLDSEDIEIVNRIIKDVSAYQNEVKALPAIGQSSFTTPSPEFVDANLSSEQNIVVEESLSLADKEKEMIEKALEKHRGKRKTAASELGISERTLYRKIKEYNIQL
jgi:transcriptional regulator with PAS, ATPase and Fis domain